MFVLIIIFVRYDSVKNHLTKIGNYYYRSNNWTFLQKVAVKILHGCAGTQNELGGLTVYPQVAHFLYVCVQKNVEISWQ